jgi:hypothetical protein
MRANRTSGRFDAVGMGRAGQGREGKGREGLFLLLLLLGCQCARGVLEGVMSFSMSDAMSLIFIKVSGGKCQPGIRGLPCPIL